MTTRERTVLRLLSSGRPLEDDDLLDALSARWWWSRRAWLAAADALVGAGLAESWFSRPVPASGWSRRRRYFQITSAGLLALLGRTTA